jgi:3-hydroxybutyrate dehydrogenase
LPSGYPFWLPPLPLTSDSIFDFQSLTSRNPVMTEPTAPARMLTGRVAAVTGSTSGIGLAVAEALAAQGCAIALSGFGDAAVLEKLRADTAEKHGVKVTLSMADLSKPDQVVGYVTQTISDHGALDILVNNAGVQHVAPIDEFPVDKWDLIISLNLSAAFHAIRTALPGMKARNWGRIINMASAHGLVASPFKSAYVSAKHGLVGMTKTVALEVAETNITCNAICPGFVNTPLVQGQIRDQAKANNMPEDRVVKEIILASQPTKRFVEASDLADFAVFLCSDGGRNWTGTAVSIDGGWTAR